jgi:hypothetical protein
MREPTSSPDKNIRRFRPTFEAVFFCGVPAALFQHGGNGVKEGTEGEYTLRAENLRALRISFLSVFYLCRRHTNFRRAFPALRRKSFPSAAFFNIFVSANEISPIEKTVQIQQS